MLCDLCVLCGSIVPLLLAGCGNAAQQEAFEAAARKEQQQLTSDNAPAVIADYKRVIALQPGSRWATKAHERIAALEAQLKAEELHKSVFQEHGID